MLIDAVEEAKRNGSALHLIGLVSDGQVHSSLNHLYALLQMAKNHDLERVYVHCFLDGRDTPQLPRLIMLRRYSAKCRRSMGEIATVIGRYYAMDRDKRWERTKRAYDLNVR